MKTELVPIVHCQALYFEDFVLVRVLFLISHQEVCYALI